MSPPLITHFVLNLEKEKSYHNETLSIDRLLNNLPLKLVPDPFFILVNNPKQPLHARNSFKNILKRDYQNPLKKLTLFFLSNPVPFNEQSYQKQKGPGTSDQSLFRLLNKFTKISLLIIYYLTKMDGVI